MLNSSRPSSFFLSHQCFLQLEPPPPQKRKGQKYKHTRVFYVTFAFYLGTGQ